MEDLVIFFNSNNKFDFGASVSVYASHDSLDFGTIYQDTLFVTELTANSIYTDSVMLSHDKLDLFNGHKLFLKPDVKISGLKDDNGDSMPSSIFLTDNLSMIIYGRVVVIVDPMDVTE